MLELGSKFLISYFIGSLMGAMIVGKLRGGVDIRTMGSGNAGGTNALRTQGVLFALGVVIVDVGKGALGAGVVPGLNLPFIPQDPEISRNRSQTDHRGLARFCLDAHIDRFCGAFHDERGHGSAGLVGTHASARRPAALHLSNIQRMLAGNENRNPKMMLFKPKDQPDENDRS
jgi:hypothetical protein